MSKQDDAVTQALDQTWTRIQERVPSVPNAAWYLTAGRSSSCATGPWDSPDAMVLRINLKKDGKPDGENRDGRDVVGQLLHWGAHAAVGINPGAEGRYHSREFGEVAEKLGLKIKLAPGTGYAPELDPAKSEVLSLHGEQQFRAEIRAVDKAMKAWEPVAEDASRKRVRAPVGMSCSCVPPRRIYASSGTALGRGIRCDVCSELFRINPGQRISEADRT